MNSKELSRLERMEYRRMETRFEANEGQRKAAEKLSRYLFSRRQKDRKCDENKKGGF